MNSLLRVSVLSAVVLGPGLPTIAQQPGPTRDAVIAAMRPYDGPGATMIYVAMFDEMDEGTAIFKCTDDPPVGASRFLTLEGLPSDHYLWLTGLGGKVLRGDLEPTEELPARKNADLPKKQDSPFPVRC